MRFGTVWRTRSSSVNANKEARTHRAQAGTRSCRGRPLDVALVDVVVPVHASEREPVRNVGTTLNQVTANPKYVRGRDGRVSRGAPVVVGEHLDQARIRVQPVV